MHGGRPVDVNGGRLTGRRLLLAGERYLFAGALVGRRWLRLSSWRLVGSGLSVEGAAPLVNGFADVAVEVALQR